MGDEKKEKGNLSKRQGEKGEWSEEYMAERLNPGASPISSSLVS